LKRTATKRAGSARRKRATARSTRRKAPARRKAA
jgi:hypothetical protein